MPHPSDAGSRLDGARHLWLSTALPGDRGELAEDGVPAVFDGGGEDEAGDGIAVGQEGFNQRFEVGEIRGRYLEQEVVAARQVVALADFFEGLYVVEEAMVVLAGAAHADEGEDFEAEGFAIDFDGIAAENADLFHLLEPFAGGGCGEADTTGELSEAEASVGLELMYELSSMEVK